MKKALLIIVAIGLLGVLAALTYNATSNKSTSNGSSSLGTNSAGSETINTSADQASQVSVTPGNPSVAYKDGNYTGSKAENRYGTVQVKITVSGGKISDVTFLSAPEDSGKSIELNDYAKPRLINQTLSAQSTNISGVSGVSATSESYVESLQAAIDQAAS